MGNVRSLAVGTAVVGLVLAGTFSPLAAAERGGAPEAISPSGAAGLGEALVEVRCPTFSWSGVEGAHSYELVVLAASAGAVGAEAAEPLVVTRAKLAAGARAWVPSLGNCLERGGRYAWSVRAVTPAGEGPWSAPALFRVAAGPSVEEVEAAMETLRRFVSDQRPEGEAMAERRAEARRETSRQGLGEERDRRASDGQELAPARQRLSPGTMDLLAAGAEGGPEISLASAPVLGSPSLSVTSNIALGAESNLFKDGAVFFWDDDSANTALGRHALESATGTAKRNTAVGRKALANTTEGAQNVFGSYNSALGYEALMSNTTGFLNTASGNRALNKNTSGGLNTASGHLALSNNTTGYSNSAFGNGALASNITGAYNLALGSRAGIRLGNNTNETELNHNIFIANEGEAEDKQTIRIGNNDTEQHLGTQNKTFIAGIHGTIITGGQTVKVDANGQLGIELTISSSRFKEGIEGLGEVGERLATLRPVTFRYRSEIDPDGGLQVGLIAEEVAALFPELVTRDAEGRPYGVRYDLLSVVSLAELQRERQRGLAHEGELARHRQEVAALRERMSALESTGSRPSRTSWWNRRSADRDSP